MSSALSADPMPASDKPVPFASASSAASNEGGLEDWTTLAKPSGSPPGLSGDAVPSLWALPPPLRSHWAHPFTAYRPTWLLPPLGQAPRFPPAHGPAGPSSTAPLTAHPGSPAQHDSQDDEDEESQEADDNGVGPNLGASQASGQSSPPSGSEVIAREVAELVQEANVLVGKGLGARRSAPPPRLPGQALLAQIQTYARQTSLFVTDQFCQISGKSKAELTDAEKHVIAVQVEEEVKYYKAELGAEEDLEFYRQHFLLQDAKDSLAQALLPLLTFAKAQLCLTDVELINEVVEDDEDRPDATADSPEPAPAEKLAPAPAPAERLKRLALHFILPQCETFRVETLAPGPAVLLSARCRTPEAIAESSVELERSLKAVEDFCGSGQREEGVDFLSFEATLEDLLRHFAHTLSLSYHRRIAAFEEEQRQLVAYLRRSGVGRTSGEYHLLHHALVGLQALQDHCFDTLTTLNDWASDVFATEEVDNNTDEEDEEEDEEESDEEGDDATGAHGRRGAVRREWEVSEPFFFLPSSLDPHDSEEVDEEDEEEGTEDEEEAEEEEDEEEEGGLKEETGSDEEPPMLSRPSTKAKSTKATPATQVVEEKQKTPKESGKTPVVGQSTPKQSPTHRSDAATQRKATPKKQSESAQTDTPKKNAGKVEGDQGKAKSAATKPPPQAAPISPSAGPHQKPSSVVTSEELVGFKTLNVFAKELSKVALLPPSLTPRAVQLGDLRFLLLRRQRSPPSDPASTSNDWPSASVLAGQGLTSVDYLVVPLSLVPPSPGSPHPATVSNAEVWTLLTRLPSLEEKNLEVGDAEPEDSAQSPSAHPPTAAGTALSLAAFASTIIPAQTGGLWRLPRPSVAPPLTECLRCYLAAHSSQARGLAHCFVECYLPLVEHISPTSLLRAVGEVESPTKGLARVRVLAPLSTILEVDSPASGPSKTTTLLDCLVRFYLSVYEGHSRKEEWKKDKERKHEQQARIAKTELLKFARRFAQICPLAPQLQPSVSSWWIWG